MEGDKEMNTDSQSSDIRTFKYIQSDVQSWISNADILVSTAYKLEAERDSEDSRFISRRFENVYKMLIGFALENYYKGAIIANLLKSDEHIKADRLHPSIKKHQLEELASDARVTIKNSQHKSYLKHITECAVWRGRYPLPIKASDIDGSIEYELLEELQTHVVSWAEDAIPIDTIHELIDQAKANLGIRLH